MDLINTSILNTINLSSTTDGVLTKWFSDDLKSFYKTGEFKYGEYNNTPPINECICSDLARALNIDSIEYNLIRCSTKNEDCVQDSFLACVSKNYNLELDNSTLFTATSLLDVLGISYSKNTNLFNDLINKIPNLKIKLSKMIIFDFIINNVDRHLNNFLFKVTDNNITLFSLFDNERSLFYDFNEEQCNRFLRDGFYNKQIDSSKPFRFHHYKQIMLVDNVYDINLDIDVDSILYKYKDLIPNYRYKAISKLIKERLCYVKQVFINEGK